MSDRPEMSYIGRKHCGCVVCAMVDSPDMKRHIASEIASWIRDGLTIERVTHDYVREHFTWDCPHIAPKANTGQMELPL